MSIAVSQRQMVEEVLTDAAQTAVYTGRKTLSAEVVAAISKVERHRFLPGDMAPLACLNRPLPIGYEQTISQPFIVALMTELLGVHSGDKVLEIGTGSGYQAAILAEMGMQIYSVEIIDALAKLAAAHLKATGYSRDMHLRTGDGYDGWPEAAPFDAIIVTAAASHVPPALIEQLKTGGRLVIPLGVAFQSLMLLEKQTDGSVATRDILPVRFVPLTGGH
jgi:protein-L-isoaspartate(D-aspartate) O-methyltransferase